MIGTLDHMAIEALLRGNVIGRIGCSHNGFTYVVPISYAYHEDCIYAHTTEGLKLDLMRKNPEVCFEVDNTTDMANWQSVIAWGKFKEITAPEEMAMALKLLTLRNLPLASSSTTHLGKDWPFISKEMGEENEIGGVFFKIDLIKKSGRFETSGNTNHLA